MTAIQDMEKELKRLEDERFYLAMKDMWSMSDYEKDDMLCDEIKKLKEMLDK